MERRGAKPGKPSNSRRTIGFCHGLGHRMAKPAAAAASPGSRRALLPVSTARRLRAFTYAEPAASNLDFGPSWNGALHAEHSRGGCHGNCAGNNDPCHLGAVGGDEPRLLANRAGLTSHEEHEERQ